MGERNRLAAAIDRQRALEQGLADAVGLAELAEEEGDEGTLDEVERELAKLKEASELRPRVERCELDIADLRARLDAADR